MRKIELKVCFLRGVGTTARRSTYLPPIAVKIEPTFYVSRNYLTKALILLNKVERINFFAFSRLSTFKILS